MDENVNSINIYDMGFLYGFSLFETFLVNSKGSVFLLDKHIERLLDSLAFFKFQINLHKDTLINEIQNYIINRSIQNKVLRVTITYGNPAKTLNPSLVITQRQNNYCIDDYARGHKITMSDIKKSAASPLLRHKTANYLENFLILKEANQLGFDDVLFLNTDNHITETTKSNLFFFKSGILYTPEVECGLLPGIIRNWVIDTVQKSGIPCIEGKFGLDFTEDADEVFATNSVMGIMPVFSIDKIIFDVSKSKIIKFLSNVYRDNQL